MSEPEPQHVEPESENTTLAQAESEHPLPESEQPLPETDSVWPEPEPDWSTAIPELGAAWYLHVYTVVTAFFIIACITVFSMCFYLKNRQTMKQGTMTFSLQCLLLVFLLFRALFMFVDPYNAEGRVGGVVTSVIWSLSTPALTAAFSVLLLVFLDTTKMTLGPPRFQKLSIILKFTLGHYVVEIVSEVAYVFSTAFKPLLLLCHVLFIVYGLLLGVGYMYTAVVINEKCKAGGINGQQKDISLENEKIHRIVRMSVLASLTAFSIAFTNIYGAASVFGIYSDVIAVDAWDWWVYQSLMRAEEVLASVVIVTIAYRNPLSEQCCLMKCMEGWRKNKTTPTQVESLLQGPQLPPFKTSNTTTISEIHTSLAYIKVND